MEGNGEDSRIAELRAKQAAQIEAMRSHEAQATFDAMFTMTPEQIQASVQRYRDSSIVSD